MGLRLIAGPPGSGKTRKIISEIVELNASDPLGPPLILLVPEQATLQTERLLLRSGAKGTVRVEVVSFARLGRWIQARRPRKSRPVLTDVHREVIVTSVLTRMRKRGQEEGLISVPHLESAVAALLGEMKQGNVRAAELMDWARRLEDSHAPLARKLLQLAEVVIGFDEAVAERFEDPQDTMLSLARSVREMDDLAGARVYVDSFYGFTAVEREILRGLVAGFPHVTITLVLDRPIRQAVDAKTLADSAGGRCAPSMETLGQLLRIAEQESGDAPELIDLGGTGEEWHRFQTKDIAHLAREFLSGKRGENWHDAAPHLRLVVASDLRDQARAAAFQIEEWHRDNGWHWGEMAIIGRDVDGLAQELGEALAMFRIPHFMDRHQPEETHPIIQGTLAALDTVLRGWHQDSLFAFAKSGLFGFDVAAVSRLEWFAQQYPRSEKHWKQRDKWEEPPERSPFEPGEGRRNAAPNMDVVDETRRIMLVPLKDLEERVESARKEDRQISAQGVVEAICQLIHEGMQPQLEALRKAGEEQRIREEESVLTQVGRLLDAIATAAGEKAFEESVLLDLLTSVLGKFRVQRIPPHLDQLVVAQVDRSRLHEVRGVVVIGLAEGEFPLPGLNRTLLSDEDRVTLTTMAMESIGEKEIKASSRELFRRESFFAWMAMARASHAVTLVRPKTSRKGEELKPSPWWFEVRRLFPRIEEESTSASGAAQSIARPREAAAVIGSLWGGMRDLRPPLSEEHLLRYAELLGKEEDKQEYQRVIVQAMRRNQAVLDSGLAREVLGDSWSPSATALESFASCPFQFFMKHVMRPELKQDSQANSMDLGNLAHAVLKDVFDQVGHSTPHLSDHDDEAIARLVATCMAEPVARLRKAGIFSNCVGAMQVEMLESQIMEIVKTFRDLAKHASLITKYTEKTFDHREGTLTPPLITVEWEGGQRREISLRGQIDRIDVWGEGWLFVLDYKLSSRAIKWAEVADGKSVQLPIYLLALEANREELAGPGGKLGGAFYAAITSKESDKQRMRGLITSSAALELDLLEEDSRFICAGRGKDVDARSQGDLVSDEALDTLMNGARGIIANNLRAILEGVVSVRPARLGKVMPCTYCDHRMACRLDYAMNQARIVGSRKKSEALAHLAAVAQGDDK